MEVVLFDYVNAIHTLAYLLCFSMKCCRQRALHYHISSFIIIIFDFYDYHTTLHYPQQHTTTGALNGRTIEHAEAQAVLQVCKWRYNMLMNEQSEVSVAPRGRWGASLVAQGQRMLYIGLV